jgi:hypothetical protein
MSKQWYCPECGVIDEHQVNYPNLGTYHYCTKCIDKRVSNTIPPFIIAMQDHISALEEGLKEAIEWLHEDIPVNIKHRLNKLAGYLKEQGE